MINTKKLQYALNNDIFTDLQLTLSDAKTNITTNVHKNILYSSAPFFEKLLTNFKEKNLDEITIIVPNASVTKDIIMSFYGLNNSVSVNWQYQLEWIQCCDYLGIDYDLARIKDLTIPANGIPLLFAVGEITNYPDIVVDLLAKNIPGDYNFGEINKNLFTKITKLKNNIEKIKNSRIISTGYDGQIKIWNPETFQLVKTIKADGEIIGLFVSPDAKSIITTYRNGISKLFDTVTGQLIKRLIMNNYWTDDANYILPVHYYRKDDMDILFDNINYETRIFFAFSPDSQKIISSSQDDGTIQIWDIDGTLIRTIDNDNGSSVYNLSITTLGDKIISNIVINHDEYIRIHNFETG